ncbi:MAG: DUF357 domain-containing protein [Candidatus Bathyarchaeia archaeon]|nr:DUF357 domain-containing protein [Candidatus Bathyarchaeota archaeon]
MALEELAAKYIQKTERVLSLLKSVNVSVFPDEKKVYAVVDEAKRYLEDAKYYYEEKRFETSLVSVAYCEGLLDSLRMLGYVEFTW